MKLDLEIAGRTVVIEAAGKPTEPRLSADGREVAPIATWISPHRLSLVLDGKSFDVEVLSASPEALEIAVGARVLTVRNAVREGERVGRPRKAQAGRVLAPMPGKVVAVLVKPGDQVSEGQGVAVVEAMKMENELTAPIAGRVVAVHVGPGQIVDLGTLLVDVVAAEPLGGEGE